MVTLTKFWWASSRRTSSYWGHTVQCIVLRSKTVRGSNQSRFARSTEKESTQITKIHILKFKAYFRVQIRHPAYREVQLYNPLNRVFLIVSSDCSRVSAHTEGSLSSETRYRTRPTQHSRDWHENINYVRIGYCDRNVPFWRAQRRASLRAPTGRKMHTRMSFGDCAQSAHGNEGLVIRLFMVQLGLTG